VNASSFSSADGDVLDPRINLPDRSRRTRVAADPFAATDEADWRRVQAGGDGSQVRVKEQRDTEAEAGQATTMVCSGFPRVAGR
jgi:hypothetical protein